MTDTAGLRETYPAPLNILTSHKLFDNVPDMTHGTDGFSQIREPAFVPFAKHRTPDWAMFRLPGRPLLAVQVNESAFGRPILDIATSLQVARRDNADVYFMPVSEEASKYRVNKELLTLECAGTRIVSHASMRGRIARRLWDLRRHAEPYLGALSRSRSVQGQSEWQPTFRRRLFGDAMPAVLSSEQVARSRRALSMAGLSDDMPIVTLHLRDQSHDAGDNLSQARIEAPSRRNTTVDTYLPAIEYLASKGFKIVRLGPSHETAIDHPAIINLSGVGADRPLLEIHALFHSRFFICSDSGPMLLPLLTGTPSLLTNGTHWACQYPLKKTDVYLLKSVRDNVTGKTLSVDDMFGEEFVAQGYTDRYTFLDNTPDDLLHAVQEIESILDGKQEMSSAQTAFKKKCERLGAVYQESDRLPAPVRSVFRKWANDDGFLGNGRIASAFLNKMSEPD